MTPQKVFQILVLLYTVSNMASMGLELNLRETLKSLRSVMAIGQSSRNISAGFVAFYGITNPPEGMFLMVLLVVPIHVIIGLLAVPPIFAKQASGAGVIDEARPVGV